MMQPQLSNLVLNESNDLFWMINLELQLNYANASYLKFMKEMTGVEMKLNKDILVESLGEDYIKKWKAYYDRALKGENFRVEERIYNPELNVFQFNQITFQPIAGDDHKIFAVVCQSKDISHAVQQNINVTEMINASLDVFCTVNEQGKFVYVSAAAANHWGYLPEELIGKPYEELILEEDVPKTNEIAAAVFGGKEITSFVNRYKKKHGGIAYNLWSARWDDSTKLLYCVARDGKERIEQEEKILQSEQRFRALVQEGCDLIRILDAGGKFVYVSPSSFSILGKAPEEFMGKNAVEFVHPDDAEKFLAGFKKIITEKRLMLEPYRVQNHKKEWRWIETIFTNMLDNPEVNGIVSNSKDITDKIEEKYKLKLLESVITNTKDAILITEAEPFDEPGPKILFVNEAFTKMTGYEANEVIGKTPRMLQGPNSNKEELAKLSRAIRNWEPCEITIINYRKNGEEFWINFTVSPVANEKGWYTHWISIERDVTEQKIAAEKLQKAFEEKNKTLESIGDAFFAVDNNGMVTYWNKEAELVLGKKKELMVGKYLWNEYADAMDSEFFLQFQKAMETRESANFEAYSPKLNIWLEVSGYPSEEGLSVYFKDVTLRKTAELELRLSNERFEKVTEATKDAIWDWDLVNQTYLRSKAIEGFFGEKSSNSFINKGFWKENFHPEDFTKIQKSINGAIANPCCNRWELEYRVLNKKRKTLYVINRGIIIRNNEGKAIRIVGAMTNISEQKKMTLQLSELNKSLQQYTYELERSNEELEQFAFVASHDLQEPLRMICSFMDQLNRKYGEQLDEKAHQYIHFATDGAKRMRQIILDLLAYSKANKTTDAKEPVDLNEVLSEFKFLRGKLISEKNAVLKTYDLPILITFKAAVTQILHCLLDNALKYVDDDTAPIVEINALELDKEWQFSIKDNGIGIEAQFYDKIFVMFQRLHNKDKYDGTGIGLAITKRHVEFLEGRIWLESTPGEGSIFYFTVSKN